MNQALAQALQNPSLPHAMECSLTCQKCKAQSSCVVRGVATSTREILGDLRCSSCGGAELALGGEEQAQLEAALTRLLSSAKPHQNREAFLRGGEFFWFGETFKSPKELRALGEALATREPESGASLLKAAISMIEIRDYDRARQLLLSSHEKAPDSPQPMVLMADLMRGFGQEELAQKLARDALARKDGPLLLEGDRAALLQVAARLAATGKDAQKVAKVGRNETCPCGSGKKYKKCCAV